MSLQMVTPSLTGRLGWGWGSTVQPQQPDSQGSPPSAYLNERLSIFGFSPAQVLTFKYVASIGGPPALIPLMFAAIGGGLATTLVAAPFGVAAAVIAAPFGGSLCAVLAAFHIARQRSSEEQIRVEVDEQTDAMVAALRDLAAQAKRESGEDAQKIPKPDKARVA